MSSQVIIAGMQDFAATLAFVTVCLGLTKTLVDAGFLKKIRQKNSWVTSGSGSFPSEW
jgi:hypothetical protein